MITWGTTVPFNDETYRRGLDQYLSAANSASEAAAAVPEGEGRSADGLPTAAASVAGAARDQLEDQYQQTKAFQNMRMRANEQNAKLLGYMREIKYHDNISRVAGGRSYYDDLINDIESERYFVIISAYDFQALLKEKKPKLLWVTRVSIQKNRNRFDQDLATMVAQAAQYFGRDSGRLVREYHEGKVILGDLKVVGYEDEPAPPDDSAPSDQTPDGKK